MFSFAECYSPVQTALSSSPSYPHGQDMGIAALVAPARSLQVRSSAAAAAACMPYLYFSFYSSTVRVICYQLSAAWSLGKYSLPAFAPKRSYSSHE